MRLWSIFAAATVAGAASQLPVLPLIVSESGWTSQPISGGNFFGDVRAVVDVPPNEASFTVQIFWRRRDPTPASKGVIVVAASSNRTVPLESNPTIEPTCGVVTFTPEPEGGLYYVYYLPYTQVSPPQFWEIEFSWQGCNDTRNDESNPCVMGRRRAKSVRSEDAVTAASVCTVATPAADAVLRLESRDSFNGFTDMEMLAAPAETAAAAAALAAAGAPFGVFCEGADKPIRVFAPPHLDGSGGGIPVRWVTRPELATPICAPPPVAPGTFLAFQAGLWVFPGGLLQLSNVTASAALPGLPNAFFTFFNLGGVDPAGAAFNISWGVPAGGVGALWVGLDIPGSAAPGAYAGWMDLAAEGTQPVRVALNISILDSPAVLDGGAADISSMARLSWLNSRRGIDDTVPAPFVPVSATGGGGSGSPLTLTALLKSMQLSTRGLPYNVTIQAPKTRGG